MTTMTKELADAAVGTISEAAVRRLARQYGYVLRKSRRRNTDGLYNLFDPATGGAVLPHNDAVSSPFNWSLEAVADYLTAREQNT